MRGKLICIEGIDGSGKNTQTTTLLEKLNQQGVKTRMYSFPAYSETFFGKEIGLYLNGEFGGIDQVHPKLASLLFAGDRFEKSKQIKQDLEQGINVICDRYVESNIAHQCSKLPQAERQAFTDWLLKLEYGVFELPKPDISVLLDVPLDFSKQLVLKKAARDYTEHKEDIHEQAHGYLEVVYQVYQDLADTQGWAKVQCVDGGELRSIEAINGDLLSHVTALIKD